MSFPGRSLQRAWHIVDASTQTVGRLAANIAPLLKGKHKPTYRPNGDCGDYVVIVNAEKVNFTGKKWNDKLYRWHTGFPGGLKQRRAKEMLERQPEKILKKAILGMIHRNNLRHKYIEPRLKIYSGPNHPHTGQLPEGTKPLESHPRARKGEFNLGLKEGYAASDSYQAGTK
uniref:50S ribosomal protein L13 n=1 Tax=Chaetoceros debilis TaxID=122233 RepID=A0A7S3Q0X2_9STRA|mmetsp:Transcript_21782/g.32099  ORF Transcript_21782/g.32099 Transcript_21782/m.32099 type:complete len:172 (-) Transcript_21782:67-582(-)